MKIYMVLIDEERFFFFADESEPDRAMTTRAPHLRSRGRASANGCMTDIAKFKAAWHDAGSGALYWMRRAWDWLHTLARPDEAMLARLRSVAPDQAAPSGGDEAKSMSCAEWRNYLTRQWRRHYFWLGVQRSDRAVRHLALHLAGPELDRDLVRLSGRSPHDRRVGNQPGRNGT